MARFLVDTFGTNHANLSGRTPETGGAWSSIVGGAATSAGRARHAAISTDNAAYQNAAAPADANYWVEAPIYRASATAQMAGPAGRITSGFNWYMAPFDDSQDEVQIISVAGGSPTELGAVAVTPPTAGTAGISRLTMDGNQISADWEGVQVIAPVTNNAHTATGRAGLFFAYLAGSSDTTGLHMLSIDAEDDLAPPPDEFDADFSGTIPAQALAAAVSRTIPNYDAAFAATIPAQSLEAEVERTVPGTDASFAATIPAQSLAAVVDREVPEYEAEFAATIPAQTLAATVGVAPPGLNASFAGTIPIQALAAEASYDPPDRDAAFAGVVPAQALVAGVSRTIPDYEASYAATVPAQLLVANLLNGEFTPAEGYLVGTITHAPALNGTISRGTGLSGTLTRSPALSATITRRP